MVKQPVVGLVEIAMGKSSGYKGVVVKTTESSKHDTVFA